MSKIYVYRGANYNTIPQVYRSYMNTTFPHDYELLYNLFGRDANKIYNDIFPVTEYDLNAENLTALDILFDGQNYTLGSSYTGINRNGTAFCFNQDNIWYIKITNQSKTTYLPNTDLEEVGHVYNAFNININTYQLEYYMYVPNEYFTETMLFQYFVFWIGQYLTSTGHYYNNTNVFFVNQNPVCRSGDYLRDTNITGYWRFCKGILDTNTYFKSLQGVTHNFNLPRLTSYHGSVISRQFMYHYLYEKIIAPPTDITVTFTDKTSWTIPEQNDQHAIYVYLTYFKSNKILEQTTAKPPFYIPYVSCSELSNGLNTDFSFNKLFNDWGKIYEGFTINITTDYILFNSIQFITIPKGTYILEYFINLIVSSTNPSDLRNENGLIKCITNLSVDYNNCPVSYYYSNNYTYFIPKNITLESNINYNAPAKLKINQDEILFPKLSYQINSELL